MYATLHHVIEQLARSTRDIVEVRVNGEPVGKLTPKMSGDVLPAVRFLAAHGRVTAARLLVSGNRAAVTGGSISHVRTSSTATGSMRYRFATTSSWACNAAGNRRLRADVLVWERIGDQDSRLGVTVLNSQGQFAYPMTRQKRPRPQGTHSDCRHVGSNVWTPALCRCATSG